MRNETSSPNGHSSHMAKPGAPKPGGSSDHANGIIGEPATDGSPTFPLFELPLELRQYVYTNILVQDKQPLHLTRRPKSDNQPKNDATAILATSRRVYLEARQSFLSGNAFVVRGTSGDLKWLKRLGREGQKQLRKVTFLNGSHSYSQSNHRTINILSGCPNLSLTIKVHYLQLVKLDQMGVLRNLHGLPRATMERRSAKVDGGCQVHQNRYASDETIKRRDELANTLLKRFTSACPRSCKVHKARTTSGSAATIDIKCDYGCPACYDGGSFWQSQWQWPTP